MIAILSKPPMKMLMPACHSAAHARPQLAFAFRMAVDAAPVAGALEAAALLTGAMAVALLAEMAVASLAGVSPQTRSQTRSGLASLDVLWVVQNLHLCYPSQRAFACAG